MSAVLSLKATLLIALFGAGKDGNPRLGSGAATSDGPRGAVSKVKKLAAAIACLFMAFPATAPAASTSEFLTHCEATPEPCKEKVLAYVKFLADGGFLDQCVMQLPAGDVAAKLVGWMRDHPEYRDRDWIDCVDDAIAALKLCNP